jgi:AcrR family transcriptional regulator
MGVSSRSEVLSCVTTYSPFVRTPHRREATIERLLTATVELLEEGGYSLFRPADIGLRCGLSNGLIFKYFPTKLDIVAAALERTFAAHLVRIMDSIGALPEHERNRRNLFELLWDVLSHPSMRWTYEIYGASAHDEDLHKKLQPVFTGHGGAIDEFTYEYLRDSHMVDSADSRMSVNLLTWAMQGLVLNDLARGYSGREHELFDYLERLANALYGPEKPRV